MSLVEPVHFSPTTFPMPAAKYLDVRGPESLELWLKNLSCQSLNTLVNDPAYFKNATGLISPSTTVAYVKEILGGFGCRIAVDPEVKASIERYAANYFSTPPFGQTGEAAPNPLGRVFSVAPIQIYVRVNGSNLLYGLNIGAAAEVTEADPYPANGGWQARAARSWYVVGRDSFSSGGWEFTAGFVGNVAHIVFDTEVTGYQIRATEGTPIELEAFSYLGPNYLIDKRPECFVSPRLTFRFGFARPGPGILEEATPESTTQKDCLGVLCNYTGSIKGE